MTIRGISIDYYAEAGGGILTDANASRRLLHNNGEDKTSIDLCNTRNLHDCSLEIIDFGITVVWHTPISAGGLHISLVLLKSAEC